MSRCDRPHPCRLSVTSQHPTVLRASHRRARGAHATSSPTGGSLVTALVHSVHFLVVWRRHLVFVTERDKGRHLRVRNELKREHNLRDAGGQRAHERAAAQRMPQVTQQLGHRRVTELATTHSTREGSWLDAKVAGAVGAAVLAGARLLAVPAAVHRGLVLDGELPPHRASGKSSASRT